MIMDCDIPGADPTTVIEQFTPYIMNLADRYIFVLKTTGAVGYDDLVQIGRIAILEAQKKYNPEKGSFMNFLFYVVRPAMRRALDFDNQTGAPPLQLVYLDEPLSVDDEITIGDTVADPEAPPTDEPIIEDETRREISKQVRDAVGRLKSDKQREAITRVWFDEQKRTQAAKDMGITSAALRSVEGKARIILRKDWRLNEYVNTMPCFSVGLSKFRRTFESAVEAAVIWKDEHPELLKTDQPEERPAGPEAAGTVAGILPGGGSA